MFFSPPIWKEAPFIRIIIPLTAGIILQSEFALNEIISLSFVTISVGVLASFSFYNTTRHFNLYWLSGVLVNSLFVGLGAMLFFSKQSINDASDSLHSGSIIVRLEEPLTIKPKSLKSMASIEVMQGSKKLVYPQTKVILYFQKDSQTRALDYGSRLVFAKKLEPITNSGNPGAFDYKRYCLFQNIHHQVYLKRGEYAILPGVQKTVVKSFLFQTRDRVVDIIRHFIPGKKEAGLAEALLIGYKNDLDKELTQSYTNTGVAHIIAISGLHVGVIYLVLTSILNFIIRSKNLRWLKILLTIAGLWIFSLLAGGSPSVLRSAVMFSFIIFGQSIAKNISIYNSLAASAFVMLSYNPYWLWDVGFQLSYAAVLGIIIFMKPIYNLIFIQNKLLDLIWKMNAVTLSAQILTTPLCLLYFNQFPTFFMITNLVAVPLSSIILFGELLLCMISFVPLAAAKLGWLLHWLIRLMNAIIDRVERLPFSLIQDIHFSMEQAILLYLLIIGLSLWLMKLRNFGLLVSLVSVAGLGIVRFYYNLSDTDHRRIIVYNVPSKKAIDLIESNKFLFIGDSTLARNQFEVNLHLRPCRVKYRASTAGLLPPIVSTPVVFKFGDHKFAVIDKPFPKRRSPRKEDLSFVIVSNNASISISSILESFDCKKIVFDSSNSWRNIVKWKKECASLELIPFSVADQGAFVMILN